MRKKSDWIYNLPVYEKERRAGIEPLFSLGNGYLCCRGFFEEEQEGIFAQGGIYMAGVFGLARYTPWQGKGRELVNTPNFYDTKIMIDGEAVSVQEEKITGFEMSLHMDVPKVQRSYTWKTASGSQVMIEFERFISGSDIHLAGEKVKITSIIGNPQIEICFSINGEVTNLNLVSSEPLPIQPGVRHLRTKYQDSDTIVVELDGYQAIQIAETQSVSAVCEEGHQVECSSNEKTGRCFTYQGIRGRSCEFSKMAAVVTSLWQQEEPLDIIKEKYSALPEYQEAFAEHALVWKEKWRTADIKIEGNEADQISLRYNLLQLMQAAPEHTSKLSIGARGLTGEMYEGCIFWDTEIFMLPFFTYSNPKEARRLLEFRYHTLENAKEHAKNNWFEGAMFPWQVSECGIEQTPQGVGAYYSIHVVADIAYAILEYWNAVGDEDFMVKYGVEILIETARFWKSRVHRNPKSGSYDILAVRGPNEYDVIVNNNLYTNMMAQENMAQAIKMIELLSRKYRKEWEELKEKLSFMATEAADWEDIMKHITICYDEKLDLYEEDDMYFSRVPLDMKKAKPTAKRIIDTTIPYEGLMLYQVSKQADVLHLMKNLHWRFTEQQKMKAWDYYVPKTCFDSSLAYSMHAVMAAQLGKISLAHSYFETSANLDIRDVQLNTISGLHFANFGGTWQAVIFGFAGLRVDEKGIVLEPHLPEQWNHLSFHLWYQEALLSVVIDNNTMSVSAEQTNGREINIFHNGYKYLLNKEAIIIKL